MTEMRLGRWKKSKSNDWNAYVKPYNNKARIDLLAYFLNQGNDNSVDSQVSFVVICIKLQSIKPSNHQIQLGQNFLMSWKNELISLR